MQGFISLDDFEDLFVSFSGNGSTPRGGPGCCEGGSLGMRESWGSPITRRGFLAWLARLGIGAWTLSALPLPVFAQGRRKIKLAFCSQLLCVIPYEVARSQGYYKEEGLDVELVYMRGGTAAMQALVGGAVDYAATSFDVALSAFARGAKIVQFFSTGRHLFILATSPKTADQIRTLSDLKGRTVGVAALGTADHLLLVYILRKAGINPESVRYATLGPNLFEALRVGHVDAGMVQEPAATLIERAGGRTLVNPMDPKHAQKYLGNPYFQFMGVSVRREEWEARKEEMRALARALTRALRYLNYGTPKLLADALPKELVIGGDRALLEQILIKYRGSLYPRDGRIRLDDAKRVQEAQRQAGVLEREVDLRQLVTNAIVESL